MNRAEFITTVVVGLTLGPSMALGQSTARQPRIGVLWGGDTPFALPYLETGRRALFDLGYAENRDFLVDARFGERKPGAVDALAAELRDSKVDVIIAAGDTAIRAARRATTTIPIVMIAAGDPVKSGLATSLARPGGNVTGMTFLTSELAGKRLQLLKEMVPTAARVGVLWNPDNPGGPADLDATRHAGESLKMTVQSFEVPKVSEFDAAFRRMSDAGVQAVAVLTDPVTSNYAGKVVADLALKHRLPTVCDLQEFTRSGALLSYGPSLRSMAQRSAVFVDKILRGAKPGDVPIEQPTSFELAVNVKTAKSLGVTVSPGLLARADHVVD